MLLLQRHCGLSLTRMHFLGLQDNGIGADGVEALGPHLAPLTSLLELDIGANFIVTVLDH